MQPFFTEVERVGLTQRRLAALMGISDAHFTKVKSGMVPLSPKFRRKAVMALGLLNVRRSDGEPFTERDLFLPSLDITPSNSDRMPALAGVA
jgi:transcriptional regulator with XRE-family HTH domain